MRFFELYLSSHPFRHLPQFSRFLLQEQLDALVRELIQLFREVDLPLLRLLAHLSDEQLFETSKAGTIELLGYLSRGEARQQIETSLQKWKEDRLGIVGQFEIMAEDITLINYVRGRAFRKFIPQFTSDMALALELINEIAGFLAGSTTAATNAYISLLKERIARHEEELLQAQRIAHIGSFELDISTGKAQCSPEVYRIYEIPQGTGLNAFMEYIHSDDLLRVQQSLQEAFHSGSYEMEYRYLKDGRLKYIYAKGITLPGNAHHPRIIGTVQDITERKIAEQALREKTVALERSNESLEQFAYVASHDLKEPVRKIATFTDRVLATEQNLSEASRTYLEKAHTSAALTRRMIDDILAYSTFIQQGEKQSCHLEDIVWKAAAMLEQGIEEKGAVIECASLPAAMVMVPQMRQLFQSLLSNALKFSRPDASPRISITGRWLSAGQVNNYHLTAGEKYLEVSVRDNGIGFDQGSSEKIFNLFHRLHSRTTYDGSGLGLAIVKRIVDNHGGVIFAHGRPGEGAVFTIILPQ